ncbi:MAG: energy transducer TonB [Reichenbachiella sp.]|uniref:energy transducer TonB family protein n=1 Tax=Reichenbachiella sp. TaxID=2184521 RepID=UPI003296B688
MILYFISLFVHLITLNQACGLSDRFNGGDTEFYTKVSNTIEYPVSNITGTVLVNWTIDNGEIVDVRILNKVDPTLDKEVLKAIKKTKGRWIKGDYSCSFTMPVVFSIGSYQSLEEYPPHYLSPVIVSRNGSTDTFVSDKKLMDMLNDYLVQENYRKALSTLNDIIVRYPMNIQIREARIKCSNKLNMNKEACLDIDFLLVQLGVKSASSCMN